LAGSLLLHLHVFLQVAHDGCDDRRANLGAGIVDQTARDQEAERVWEAGHFVYLTEKDIEGLGLVGGLGVGSGDVVLDVRDCLEEMSTGWRSEQGRRYFAGELTKRT
jgi:hypothetical protein